MLGLFTNKEKLKKELNVLTKALDQLDKRLENKTISIEDYDKQSAYFRPKIEKLEKKLGVNKYDNY